MSNDPARALTDGTVPRDLDRVRDIIFGAHMREYEQRFDTLRRDIERLHQELETLSEQLTEQDREQSKRVQTLRREARQSDDDIRTELRQSAQRLAFEKVDRLTLGELFIELGTQLKTGSPISDVLSGLLTPPPTEPRGES